MSIIAPGENNGRKSPLITATLVFFYFTILGICFNTTSFGQLRQIHVESTENDIYKTSFYTGNEGYIAFKNYIAFTADSGKTFQQHPITNTNVNFNGYAVNITFGFIISGVKAFNKNNLIVYGNYGLVPAILYSSDQGSTFKVVFHSQFSIYPNSSVNDMLFPSNGSVGYAVDNDRILKTVDGGLTWTVSQTLANSHYTYLQALSDNQVFAFSNGSTPLVYSTVDAGTSWQKMTIPSGNLQYVYFLTTSRGFLNSSDGSVYLTINGGTNWTKQNDPALAPFTCTKMQFVNDSTAYALVNYYEVYKTSNSGKIWEHLHRDNNYSYLGYTLNDLQIAGTTLWAGGGHGFLELSNNSGGTPVPKAIFTIDTSGVTTNNIVKLNNSSRSGYTYSWFRNGTAISSSYNTSYTPNIYGPNDTIKLIVRNGIYADTAIKYTSFSKGIVINGFSPISAITGATVTISGSNFLNITGVSFGGTPATSFHVTNINTLTAVVAAGSSGNITVTSANSQGNKSGFTYIPPPVISSFTPHIAASGDTVTITGTNFANINNINFGGYAAKSFKVVSATQIKAVVGICASGNIAVIGQAGTGTTIGFLMKPVITGSSPLIGYYGNTITFPGTGLADVSSVTIDGFPVKSFSASISNISAVVGDAINGSVVKVTSPGGSFTYTGFTYYNPPQITSFSPASAAPGSTITINGIYFNPVAANNLVYFGGVHATVTAATSTQLTVTVPYGSTYQPVSVTANTLTGYSARPFIPTFSGGGSITTDSFGARYEYWAGNGPTSFAIADLNNDGMPELVVPNWGTNIVSYQKNLSKNGIFKFPYVEAYPNSYNNDQPVFVVPTDYNNDGFIDIVSMSYQTLDNVQNIAGGYFVKYNGNTGYRYYVTDRNFNFAIADMDGDGHPDKVFPSTLYSSAIVSVADIDEDGKPDIVEVPANSTSFSVFLNTSTKGAITYAPKINFQAPAMVRQVVIGDIDGDGKKDIVAVTGNDNSTSGAVVVMKNTSTPGNISFNTVLTIPFSKQQYGSTSACLGDLDGDGIIDLVVGTQNAVSVYKNTSVSGTASLAPAVNFNVDGSTYLSICDLDGDSRPDIAGLGYSGGSTGFVLKNLINTPPITSFTPTSGSQGTNITITGNNFTGATKVFIDGSPVKSFNVVSATTITAVVDTSTTGYISVVTPQGIGTSRTMFSYVPPITTATGSATIARGGSLLLSTPMRYNCSYSWYKNGVYTGTAGHLANTYLATDTGTYTVMVYFYDVYNGSTFNQAQSTSLPLQLTYAMMLPANNFTIAANSATCRGSANGTITINAAQNLNYTATITGGSVNASYPFTTTKTISNLPAGTYNLCFTVAGQAAYSQCFTIVITEPKDLSVYAAVNNTIQSVNLTLDGGSTYFVTLNGVTTTTQASNITLALNKGINDVTVTTDKTCQGIYQKRFDLSGDVLAYPNPFTTVLNVSLGNDNIPIATIELFNTVGIKVYNKQFSNISGSLQISPEGLAPGMYMLKLTTGQTEKVFKVVKQ